jgi:hypothetical protein
MKIQASVNTTHLSVQVQVANDLEEPLYLQHWIQDWYGLLGIPEMNATTNRKTAGFTRELAYACVGQAGELVLLSGEGPAPPPHIMMTQPRVPQSTRLMPGASESWTIRLPLPIREWYAYATPRDQPTRSVAVQAVRYRLETLRESQCRRVPVKEFVNFPGIFQAYGLGDVREATAQLPTPITVLQRTDAFERFG